MQRKHRMNTKQKIVASEFPLISKIKSYNIFLHECRGVFNLNFDSVFVVEMNFNEMLERI